MQRINEKLAPILAAATSANSSVKHITTIKEVVEGDDNDRDDETSDSNVNYGNYGDEIEGGYSTEAQEGLSGSAGLLGSSCLSGHQLIGTRASSPRLVAEALPLMKFLEVNIILFYFIFYLPVTALTITDDVTMRWRPSLLLLPY